MNSQARLVISFCPVLWKQTSINQSIYFNQNTDWTQKTQICQTRYQRYPKRKYRNLNELTNFFNFHLPAHIFKLSIYNQSSNHASHCSHWFQHILVSSSASLSLHHEINTSWNGWLIWLFSESSLIVLYCYFPHDFSWLTQWKLGFGAVVLVGFWSWYNIQKACRVSP